jgi:hypothetical protein
MKIKIYCNIILPSTVSPNKEERRLRVFENRVLRKILGHNEDEIKRA